MTRTTASTSVRFEGRHIGRQLQVRTVDGDPRTNAPVDLKRDLFLQLFTFDSAAAIARVEDDRWVEIQPQTEAGRVGLEAEAPAAAEPQRACGRCAGTGRFITRVVNGRPEGPGGICFRCNGKGFQTRADERRNEYHDGNCERCLSGIAHM